MNPGEGIVPHEENVVAYLLGELSGDELAAFERGLAADPRLAAEVESARQVFAVLPAATAAAPPPALRERVLGAAVALFALGTENARLRRELALQGEVNSTLQQPNVVRSFAMRGRSGAFGSVLLDLDAKRGAVALHRLPAPAEGKVYRLWAQVAAKPVYCGDLTVGNDGVIRNQLPIPVESYTSPVERLYVTLEPADAPLVPSGPPLVVSG